MAKRWRVRPNKSLRENGRLLIPVMIDDFLEHRETVVAHPRLKKELHRMRLAGKSLRYAMEVFTPAFGKDFASCLDELRALLDTMGTIHDCDVHTPRIQLLAKEIRLFNTKRAVPAERMSAGGLNRLIREQQTLRQSLLTQMVATLDQWSRENFKGKVLQAMLKSSERNSTP